MDIHVPAIAIKEYIGGRVEICQYSQKFDSLDEALPFIKKCLDETDDMLARHNIDVEKDFPFLASQLQIQKVAFKRLVEKGIRYGSEKRTRLMELSCI